MAVSAVIPNWNGLRFLQPLFEDLQRQTVAFGEILVVDNGSTDGSPEWAEAHGAVVIRLGSNQGFAVAVNRGIQAAQGELVAVLNNDLTLSADWLEKISAGLGNSSFATGKVLSADRPEIIDGTWDALCRGGTALRCGSGHPDGPQWSGEREIVFPPFTAVLLRRRDFLDAGRLDEDFGSYLEDVEFGLRCGSKGYTGRYVPQAISWHIGSATLGRWNARTVRQIAKNQVLLVARHYPPAVLREFGWQIALSQVLWGLVALKHGRAGAWIHGKWEGIRSFRRYRRTGSPAVREILLAGEEEIRRVQAETGRDWYWRLYFALI